MAKKKEKPIKVDWEKYLNQLEEDSDRQHNAFVNGKDVFYEDMMYDLERKQIDSKPELESAQHFVDGYNSGIREAIRIAYANRYLWSDNEWGYDVQEDRNQWSLDDIRQERLDKLMDKYFE
jgi:hypothetical protein